MMQLFQEEVELEKVIYMFFYFCQAALERMSAHEKNAVKKPKSATATWKHSGPTSSTSQIANTQNALNLDQLKREGYLYLQVITCVRIRDKLAMIFSYPTNTSGKNVLDY